jgi:hypothetical protein
VEYKIMKAGSTTRGNLIPKLALPKASVAVFIGFSAKGRRREAGGAGLPFSLAFRSLSAIF